MFLATLILLLFSFQTNLFSPKVEKKGCGSEPGFKNQIYQRGCLREFEDRFKSNIGIVGGIFFIFIVGQLLTFV